MIVLVAFDKEQAVCSAQCSLPTHRCYEFEKQIRLRPQLKTAKGSLIDIRVV